jgi:hypothetical protein
MMKITSNNECVKHSVEQIRNGQEMKVFSGNFGIFAAETITSIKIVSPILAQLTPAWLGIFNRFAYG